VKNHLISYIRVTK